MKLLLSSLIFSLLTSIPLLAQGPLAPIAAPAPTMKTLSQVEGRTVIDPSVPGFTTPYTITQPGSYYLVGSINVSSGSAIVISADNVSLDLNGFALISTSSTASGNGIFISGARSNVTVRNGHIRGQVIFNGTNYIGGGFSNGISVNDTGKNLLVSEVAVSGCVSVGIGLEFSFFSQIVSSNVVERCRVQTVGSSGIVAGRVTACSAMETGSTAITAGVVSGSYARTEAGTYAIFGTTVENCTGINGQSVGSNSAGIRGNIVTNSYGSGGLAGISASVITGSYGVGPTGILGISLDNNATNSYGSGTTGILVETVTNCTGVGTTGPGIRAQIANNSQGRSNSGIGLQADLVATNCRGVSSSGNGMQCSVTANSCFGATSNVSAIGLKVTGTAHISGGQNTAGGIAIEASIGIGCGLYGGTSNIPAAGKFLGTP